MPRENPAVSIIVPVYNLEKLLPRCLASIAAQTTPDWECVLVDDGSADGSLAVCRQWAEQDARFRVLHQENQGVSAARNAGIQAARAPYFLFVDADDTILPETAAWALERQARHPGDLIGWVLHDQTQTPPDFDAPPCKQYTKDQLQAYIVTVPSANVTNKLFDASVIREGGVQYPVGQPRGEDMQFCIAYFHAFFAARPDSIVRQYDLPLYIVHGDNGAQRASKKAVAAHPIEWEPEQFRGYLALLRQEYRQMSDSMGGLDAVPVEDAVNLCRQYCRRFAFALWAAHQLGEPVPRDFYRWPEIRELLGVMGRKKLYNAYYWPLRIQCTPLVRAMYQSDESDSKKLFWKVYWLGWYALGGKWRTR